MYVVPVFTKVMRFATSIIKNITKFVHIAVLRRDEIK